jgi:hypothetical protein
VRLTPHTLAFGIWNLAFGICTFLFIAALISCRISKEQSTIKDMQGKTITVAGVAHNGKDGALVLTEDREAYYVDGLDAWDNSLHGKQVQVTGTLKSETFSEEDLKNEKGEWSAGMTGKKMILLQSKWRLKPE